MNKTNQRRREKRFLCADLVELVWRDSAGHETRRICNLEDICTNGMCLQLETPLSAGTRIKMPCGRNAFYGVVRYLCNHDRSYTIGVEFDRTNPWSTKLFQPRHLLDPTVLAGPLRRRSIPLSSWIN